MKHVNEHQRDFEELYEALEKISEEYPEYFEALKTLLPNEFPVLIENVTTTTPYGEIDLAKLE